jgi:hypothetical protein
MESTDRLRFVEAERLDTPVGRLSGAELVSPADERLGTLGGVLIDPVERHVRYFILELKRWHRTNRYLVPASPVHLDTERRALHVDLYPDDVDSLRECRSDSFVPFSDDDLIAALFPKA